MANRFEKVSRYKNAKIKIPVRATKGSAGYDFFAAEDMYIMPYEIKIQNAKMGYEGAVPPPLTLDKAEEMTKRYNLRPNLISTGVKCKLDKNKFLMLCVRSSIALKCGMNLANCVGIIDEDYYNNEANEGEIFLQIYNFSPFTIRINKGDKIGQGIIMSYDTVEDDNTLKERTGGFGSTTEREK